jgi:phosphate starvation-inducible PhoH-like protein
MMRGRTFNNTFVILDEAQNAVMAELRMFLTRIGLNSKMVVTGDVLQSDLPKHAQGSFEFCCEQLVGMDGVSIAVLEASDIVRHRLIADIERRLSN